MKSVSKTVAFVASKSGAGKTTIIESVLNRLNRKGYRVGVIKHAGHDASIDKEGSDSWRFTQAGSVVTVLASMKQLAVLRAVDEPSLENALHEASSGTDIVLVEGFKEMKVPKIEVFRSKVTRELCCRGTGTADPDLVAVASDVPLDVDVPLLDLNDPREVCEFIIERFIKGRDS